MTYRFLPKPTLCLGESIETLDIAADAALELGDLFGSAGNARDPLLDSSVIDITNGNGILQCVLLNCGEEIHCFDFAADGTFDPKYLCQLAFCKQAGASLAYLSGSFRFCNLVGRSAAFVNDETTVCSENVARCKT